MSILYTSDSHLSHTNIIRYCQRAFESKVQMDEVLAANLKAAVATGSRLVHCGDMCFDFARYVRQHGPLWEDPADHLFIAGNHDRLSDKKRGAYEQHFHTIVGREGTWETNTYIVHDVLDGHPVSALVSHKPQLDLQGCDVGVSGHLHNNLLLPATAHHPEDAWSMESPVHFNASVELHDYKPVTLQQLADTHRSGYAAARAELSSRLQVLDIES